jgi:hypothetical protein
MTWEEYSKNDKLILHGDYEYYLKKWVKSLGKDRIYVCTFESLVSDPKECIGDMTSFLGINSVFYENYNFIQHNETVAIKNKFIHRLGLTLQRYVPHGIQEKILPLYLKINSGKMPLKDPSDKKILKSVKSDYQDSILRLKKLFPNLNLESWA